MAVYEIIVKDYENLARVIAEVRKFNIASISEIRQNLARKLPVISIDSTEYPGEMDIYNGPIHQHERFMEAVSRLNKEAATLQLRYRASKDWEPEDADVKMIKNLMKSELQILRQEHD